MWIVPSSRIGSSKNLLCAFIQVFYHSYPKQGSSNANNYLSGLGSQVEGGLEV